MLKVVRSVVCIGMKKVFGDVEGDFFADLGDAGDDLCIDMKIFEDVVDKGRLKKKLKNICVAIFSSIMTSCFLVNENILR